MNISAKYATAQVIIIRFLASRNDPRSHFDAIAFRMIEYADTVEFNGVFSELESRINLSSY